MRSPKQLRYKRTKPWIRIPTEMQLRHTLSLKVHNTATFSKYPVVHCVISQKRVLDKPGLHVTAG